VTIEEQEHYGQKVQTDVEYDQMRRERCLCFTCVYFKPHDPEANCRIAALLYAVCRETGIAAGVSRCPVYVPNPHGKVER